MREFYCVVCGTKAIDTSNCQTKKYCSDHCRRKVFDQRRLKTAEIVCPYNEGVTCVYQKCKKCGWHPEVEKARKEKLYGQIG